ncbi:MAG: PEP-CTERM sorting domain-containing protein [Planctomycetota bacterium]
MFSRFASSRRSSTLLGTALVAGVAALPAVADEYEQIFALSDINPSSPDAGIFGVASIGGNFVFTTAFGDANENDIIQGPPFTTVIDNSGVLIANGNATGIAGGQFYANSATTSVFVDTNSDSIFTLDVQNNTLVREKSNAEIIAFTGLTSSSQQIDQGVLDSDGNLLFYNGSSDSIISLSPGGTLSTFASDSDLTSGIGTDIVRSMVSDTANQILYIGSTATDEIYSLDYSGDTFVYSTVLANADLEAFTGSTTFGPNNLFFAPDGLVYFYDSSSDGIYSFDPGDALNSLTLVIDDDALIDGPGGTAVLGGLVWVDGEIGWWVSRTFNGSVAGVYAIPEPSSLALLGLGGLLVTRRRRG